MYIFKEFSELNIKELKNEIEKERQLINDIKAGKYIKTEINKVVLFIVESPIK
jgi:hypothetical protein